MINTTLRFLLVSCFILTLAGCASKNELLSFIDFYDELDSTEDIVLQDHEKSPASPPELLPQPVEADTCINQELEALKQTGSWVSQEKSKKSEVKEYDFPVVMNKQVKMYLDLFQGKQRKYFTRWLARSTKYSPLILDELNKAGLPHELVYLAMIESGFNQRAYSRARAVGLWQFMKGTGRDYKLRIDRYVDERRDAVKSTRAAVAYLSDLYEQFGDWHLAVAAYNGGPGKIRYGIKRFKTKDFWTLAEKRYLRLETKRYVPKLIAAIIIAKNPEKYGFTNIQYEAPLEFDTIEVGPGLSVKALALISGGSKKQLMFLNQELKTDRTPLNKRRYTAKIPKGSYTLAKSGLSRLHSIVRTGYKTHIIGKNESLTAICRKYKVNKTTILKVNNLRSGTLTAGQRLRIPYSVVDYQLLPKDGSAIAQAGDSLILHTIKPGDTIGKIAKQYSVPPEMIVAWNGLKSVHRIRAGQQLALYIVDDRKMTSTQKSKIAATPSVSKNSGNNIIVLSKGKKQTPQIAPTPAQELFSWYQVKQGDTLWNISRRFNTSPKKIKQWNNLKTNLIHPGSKLKLKGV